MWHGSRIQAKGLLSPVTCCAGSSGQLAPLLATPCANGWKNQTPNQTKQPMRRKELLLLEAFYVVTNLFIIAGVIRHWNK